MSALSSLSAVRWLRTVLIAGIALGVLAVAAAGSPILADIMAYREDIAFLSVQHMELTLISGGLAILTGIPLGIVLTRDPVRKASEGIMQVLNIGTTVPTLAVLALSMTFLGIGTLPAVFALWLASLLYIVRNTYSGLMSLPPDLLEAARGTGMTSVQTLWQVELPNALFVIFAGVRTALTINVGTVPLAFLIGGGGLGELIFTGIDLNEPAMMLAGAIPTAVLAVLVDTVIAGIAFIVIPRGINPRSHRSTI